MPAQQPPRKHEIPTIPPEFIVKLKHAGDKEFIRADGLVYLGHLQGLKRVDVQVIQFPTPDAPGTCYARCEVETALGVFTDYGEVTPANKGSVGGAYPVSLACTRARNRALRQATNCPLTSYEEMGMETAGETDIVAVDNQPVGNQQADNQPCDPARLARLQKLAERVRAGGEDVVIPPALTMGQARQLYEQLSAALPVKAAAGSGS